MPSQATKQIQVHLDRWKSNDEVPIMFDRLCLAWNVIKMGLCVIRDVHGNTVALNPNEAQKRIFAKMLDQAWLGKPIRINVGKGRKLGVSTFVQVLGVLFCYLFQNQYALTLAHETQATKEIFTIARRCAESITGKAAGANMIGFGGGSYYRCQTAGAQAVGAGGTPSILHISEMAKWKANKEQTEYNARNSVPMVAETIVVDETTFVGRELAFQRFEEAHQPEHPYEPVFIAWYVDSTLYSQVPEDFVRTHKENAIAEMAMLEGITLTDGQLQWRRLKIMEIGEERFRQEYPTTPEEAVQASAGLILPMMRRCLVDEMIHDLRMIPENQRVGGIDFGYSHPTVIWSGYYTDDVLNVFSFWHGRETLAAEQVDGLVDGTTYYCDPANIGERKELANAARLAGKRCSFVPAPRLRDPGGNVSRYEMKRLVRFVETGRIRVARPISKQLILECDNLAWDEREKPAENDGPPSCFHFDAIMGLKYLVMGVDSKGKPIENRPRAMPTRRQDMRAYI